MHPSGYVGLPKPKTYDQAFEEAGLWFSEYDYEKIRVCNIKELDACRKAVVKYILNVWVRGNSDLKADMGLSLSDEEMAIKIWERIYNEAIIRDVLE